MFGWIIRHGHFLRPPGIMNFCQRQLSGSQDTRSCDRDILRSSTRRFTRSGAFRVSSQCLLSLLLLCLLLPFPRCEAERNECEGFPCLNGGLCIDELNDFTCNCTSNYTGKVCDILVSTCSCNSWDMVQIHLLSISSFLQLLYLKKNANTDHCHVDTFYVQNKNVQ